jgi:hypothetical protein
LTAAQGRRFGLTVGLAFSVFAALAWWRGHGSIATALAVLASSLIGAGVAIPTQLGPVERAWMALAHAISKVTTPIVMAVMYLAVFTPIGWLRRVLGGNPMVHAPVRNSYWQSRESGKRASNLERSF